MAETQRKAAPAQESEVSIITNMAANLNNKASPYYPFNPKMSKVDLAANLVRLNYIRELMRSGEPDKKANPQEWQIWNNIMNVSKFDAKAMDNQVIGAINWMVSWVKVKADAGIRSEQARDVIEKLQRNAGKENYEEFNTGNLREQMRHLMLILSGLPDETTKYAGGKGEEARTGQRDQQIATPRTYGAEQWHIFSDGAQNQTFVPKVQDPGPDASQFFGDRGKAQGAADALAACVSNPTDANYQAAIDALNSVASDSLKNGNSAEAQAYQRALQDLKNHDIQKALQDLGNSPFKNIVLAVLASANAKFEGRALIMVGMQFRVRFPLPAGQKWEEARTTGRIRYEPDRNTGDLSFDKKVANALQVVPIELGAMLYYNFLKRSGILSAQGVSVGITEHGHAAGVGGYATFGAMWGHPMEITLYCTGGYETSNIHESVNIPGAGAPITLNSNHEGPYLGVYGFEINNAGWAGEKLPPIRLFKRLSASAFGADPKNAFILRESAAFTIADSENRTMELLVTPILSKYMEQFRLGGEVSLETFEKNMRNGVRNFGAFARYERDLYNTAEKSPGINTYTIGGEIVFQVGRFDLGARGGVMWENGPQGAGRAPYGLSPFVTGLLGYTFDTGGAGTTATAGGQTSAAPIAKTVPTRSAAVSVSPTQAQFSDDFKSRFERAGEIAGTNPTNKLMAASLANTIRSEMEKPGMAWMKTDEGVQKALSLLNDGQLADGYNVLKLVPAVVNMK